MSGSGPGSKLSTRVIGYLSLSSRLSSLIGARSGAPEKLSLATEQSVYSFPGSFFFKSSVGINSDGIKFYFSFGSSVRRNGLTLGGNKDGGIASGDGWKVGDGNSLGFLLTIGLSALVQVDSLIPESLKTLFLPLFEPGSERTGPVQSNWSNHN